jgi:hypothetical protein
MDRVSKDYADRSPVKLMVVVVIVTLGLGLNPNLKNIAASLSSILSWLGQLIR